jgi:hypothetical protein
LPRNETLIGDDIYIYYPIKVVGSLKGVVPLITLEKGVGSVACGSSTLTTHSLGKMLHNLNFTKSKCLWVVFGSGFGGEIIF